MLPSFSSGNQVMSGMFPEGSAAAGVSSERANANIWSNNTGGSSQRAHHTPSVDPRNSPWGSYASGGNGPHPEYQPSWNYQQHQQHPIHLRESHSLWAGTDHDQAWKYSRNQSAPGTGVWQYPSSQAEYHEWGNRAAQQQVGGYYYVSSGHPHDQRQDEYIPYDIGARRAYQMPPPPPGYPLPPHMQYYGQGATTGAATSVPPPMVDMTAPAGSPIRKPAGGAASFLFEAAAAAMSKPAVEDSPIAEKKVEQPPVVPLQVKKEEEGSKNTSARAVARNSTSGSVHHNNRARVNNHQLRLHASGNEKAPLAVAGVSSQVTTLMIRNIPNRYTQTELLAEIKEAGFDNKFDFFYLPMDHETHANFGYAFINFVDEREVDPFTKRFNGLKLNRFTSNKIIQIVPAQLQGFQANLQHYCKKAVCTDDNIDYRPLFFVDGKCLEFHRASDFTDAVKAQQKAANPTVTTPTSVEEDSETGRRANRNNSAATNKGVFQRKTRNE